MKRPVSTYDLQNGWDILGGMFMGYRGHVSEYPCKMIFLKKQMIKKLTVLGSPVPSGVKF